MFSLFHSSLPIVASLGFEIPNKDLEVVREIGSGAFGKTYLAKMKSKGNIEVAVKQLDPEIVSIAESMNIFMRQKEGLHRASKRCKYIPESYDNFVATTKIKGKETKTLYLVQEYIPGPNLDEVCRSKGPFQETEVLKFLGQMLNILAVLHKEQVYHRDIKPSNIIKSNVNDCYYFVDFGAAKINEKVYSNAAPLGSALFTAPETLLTGEYSSQSDLYSLGITCMALLIGSSSKLLSIAMETEPTESAKQMEQMEISEHLSDYINGLIHKDKSQRYFSAEEALDALELTQNLLEKS